MTLQNIHLSLVIAVSMSVGATSFAQSDTNVDAASNNKAAQINEHAPGSVDEARGRAKLLHETIHGVLQVMHRDFFREDEALKIPSHSLLDVFSELSKTYGVQVHWLAVDLKAMNVDNEPKSEFDKAAVLELKAGKDQYESVTNNEYSFAGKIRLSTSCLSCHASRRTNNDARSAGLVITMPLKKQDLETKTE